MADCPGCGQDHAHNRIPDYDVDRAIKDLARARLSRDEFTQAQVRIGDRLAAYMVQQFSPEEMETAGRAALIGAASIAALLVDEMPGAVLINVLGFAGARLVQDGRAWEPDGTEVTR